MAWLLENERLKITIGEPGELYKGSRFDRTGNISQVVLDGKYEYCAREKIVDFDAGKHGQGLYNEFGINKPIGFEECKEGEKFLKIGVGLLTRTSKEAYDFFTSYPVQPFNIIVDKGHDFISFSAMPENCKGYAVKLVKIITVSGNEITIDYSLENTGTKSIHTNEYCHNFIAINQTSIDSNYSLKVDGIINEFSEMTEALNPENAAVAGRDRLDFKFAPQRDIFFSPFAVFTSGGMWEITHQGLRSGIREQTDFVPAVMNVWGSTHVISPELFMNIDLDPGKLMTWRRTFNFFAF